MKTSEDIFVLVEWEMVDDNKNPIYFQKNENPWHES